jgi:dipeptidyl aminopeptidase/acylaminoacyl peptidase
MLKRLQLDDAAPWKQRFRASSIDLTQLATAQPTRGLAISKRKSKAMQLYAWDVPGGQLRQLTDMSSGVIQGWISPDGRHVYYLQDRQGDELGHIVRLPFEGGKAQDLTPDLLPYTLRGFEISRAGNLLAFNPVNADGFQLYCMALGPQGELGPLRLIYQTQQETWESILSHGGEIATMKSTERAGGMRRYSTLAFDVASGEQMGELWDGLEHSVEPVAFAPLAGDWRLLASTTLSGFSRPLIWNPRTGERRDLSLPELQGEVMPLDWSPDGKRVLLHQLHQAVQQFYLYDLDDDALIKLDHPAGGYGYFGGAFGGVAYFEPQGQIFAHWQDATHPMQLVALDGETGAKTRTVLTAGDVPPGHPWQSITFSSSDGQAVQGWLGLPEGEGPFPTILTMHGGPHAVIPETFSPESQAWLDHGFVYLSINFRGSTTFGREFQEKIWGNIGHWELEDMVAARNWLVEQNIARPDAIFLSGWSYGGYLTLWGLGKRPDLWAGGMAAIAIADWAVDYEDSSDALKGASRAWFGGSPEEKPEQFKASSPITYAENVRAPLLVIQGRNDTRTSPRQMELYEARIKSLGKSIEVFWFDGGHMETAAEQEIRFQEQKLRFAYRVLGQ